MIGDAIMSFTAEDRENLELLWNEFNEKLNNFLEDPRGDYTSYDQIRFNEELYEFLEEYESYLKEDENDEVKNFFQKKIEELISDLHGLLGKYDIRLMDNFLLRDNIIKKNLERLNALNNKWEFAKLLRYGARDADPDKIGTLKMMCDLAFVCPDVFLPAVLERGINTKFIVETTSIHGKKADTYYIDVFWYIATQYEKVGKKFSNKKFPLDTVNKILTEHMDKLFIEAKNDFYLPLFKYHNLEFYKSYIQKENTDYLENKLLKKFDEEVKDMEDEENFVEVNYYCEVINIRDFIKIDLENRDDHPLMGCF